jgi:hypothetical protein
MRLLFQALTEATAIVADYCLDLLLLSMYYMQEPFTFAPNMKPQFMRLLFQQHRASAIVANHHRHLLLLLLLSLLHLQEPFTFAPALKPQFMRLLF